MRSPYDLKTACKLFIFYELPPKTTGMAVIKSIVNPNDKRFSGGASALTKCFIERIVTIGKVIIVNKLITAVYDIESAVSPLASFVIMFDVTHRTRC